MQSTMTPVNVQIYFHKHNLSSLQCQVFECSIQEYCTMCKSIQWEYGMQLVIMSPVCSDNLKVIIFVNPSPDDRLLMYSIKNLPNWIVTGPKCIQQYLTRRGLSCPKLEDKHKSDNQLDSEVPVKTPKTLSEPCFQQQ